MRAARTRRISLLWVSNSSLSRILPFRAMVGNVPAVLWLQANSAPNAEQRDPRPKIATHGLVPAVLWQQESSAPSAEQRSPKSKIATHGLVPAVQKRQANSAPNAEQRDPRMVGLVPAEM